MAKPITRRRTLAISAAAAGLSLLPFGHGAARGTGAAGVVTWRGTALGALATLTIHHPDRSAALRLVDRATAEVRRLEAIFSLYRRDSALVALNRDGMLAAPPPELVALLTESRRYGDLTHGAFDVTVQPLWSLYAQHFSQPEADPSGPPAAALSAALARIGHAALRINPDRIAFARRGMAVTLNGIAQGCITDRVVDLLRAAGISQTLVDMGEIRCVGSNPDGAPWSVGIDDPQQPGRIRDTLEIIDRAVATSGAYGFQFDPQGRFNHLFDPKTGGCAHAYQSVTVVADTATEADALSTAFSLMPMREIEQVLAANDRIAAYVLPSGRSEVRKIGSLQL